MSYVRQIDPDSGYVESYNLDNPELEEREPTLSGWHGMDRGWVTYLFHFPFVPLSRTNRNF